MINAIQLKGLELLNRHVASRTKGPDGDRVRRHHGRRSAAGILVVWAPQRRAQHAIRTLVRLTTASPTPLRS
jgi:hypothetical protein